MTRISTAHMIGLFIIATMWGASFSLIKIGVSEVGPATLAAGRIVIAASVLLFWLFCVRRRQLVWSLTAFKHYLVMGAVGYSLPFFLVSFGEQYLDSAYTSIAFGLIPVFTMIMAHYFLHDEPFNRNKLVGIALGFIGLLLLLQDSALTHERFSGLAALAVVTATFCYSSVSVYVRLNVAIPSLDLATGSMLCAAIISSILAFGLEYPLTQTWSQSSLFAMSALGLFPTAIATLLYIYMIRKIGAVMFSFVNYLVPIIGTVIGITWMDEKQSWLVWLAMTLVILGLYVTQSAPRPSGK